MRWLVLVSALVLAGCAGDFGTRPSALPVAGDPQDAYPVHYRQNLLAFLRSYLNDPEHLRDGAVSPPQFMTVGQVQRYVVCVRYNARNYTGHYAGVKGGAVVYKAGRLDHFLAEPRQVKELCKGATYTPFPALAKLTRN